MQGLESPESALSAWALGTVRLAPLGSGLINRTWLVTAGPGRYVLQQVNPIFPGAVNGDIDVVTRHLRAKGLVSPALRPTAGGQLWVDAPGGAWRLMTHVDGISHDRLASPAQAEEAGRYLASFHAALADLRHAFSSPRAGVHDTPRHLAVLRQALVDHADHRDIGDIRPLAEDILALAADLPAIPAQPPRVVHGDPKVNNLLFDEATGRAVCLIDLDTLGHMPLHLELGDAFRSWCNPKGEDSARSAFSLDLFAAAVRGYAGGARSWVTAGEVAALVPGTLTIYVELAARFCADALRECYFGWDPGRYPTRSVHNRVRAASQITAARALWAVRAEAEAAVRNAFGKEGST